MALAPKFAGQKFTAINAPTLHTLELYLDYVCPYSAKMFTTVYTSVLPLIRQKYASKVQLIFRQQIQPWHPSSTLVHEAGVAVLKMQPSKFWDFSKVRTASSICISEWMKRWMRVETPGTTCAKNLWRVRRCLMMRNRSMMSTW